MVLNYIFSLSLIPGGHMGHWKESGLGDGLRLGFEFCLWPGAFRSVSLDEWLSLGLSFLTCKVGLPAPTSRGVVRVPGDAGSLRGASEAVTSPVSSAPRFWGDWDSDPFSTPRLVAVGGTWGTSSNPGHPWVPEMLRNQKGLFASFPESLQIRMFYRPWLVEALVLQDAFAPIHQSRLHQ